MCVTLTTIVFKYSNFLIAFFLYCLIKLMVVFVY